MKRRHFSAGLVGGVAIAGSGIATAAISETVKASSMQQPEFQARIDHRVLLRSVGVEDQFPARISAVEGAGKRDQFYLRFTALKPTECAEGLYLLEMPGSSEMLLHMTPSASDPHTLEAVINNTAV